MKELKDKILKEGKILPGNIVKVDSFLNHQINVKFIEKVGKEFYELYKDTGVNKIVTIETSGIPIAVETAKLFDCKVVFAKKNKSKNMSDDFYVAKVVSFTHGGENDIAISKEYLNKDDVVLVIDDFLANGSALSGLLKIINDAGAKCVGCGIVIEKGFQPGGKTLRDKGIRVDSLAIIDKIDVEKQTIEFRS